MAALHGREDPLLEPPRFARLLRQANDAEVADVRKVGDDAYEITLSRRLGGAPAPSAGAARPEAQNGSAFVPTIETPAVTAARPGVRFRRGSRAPTRPGELSLIGVVNMDVPAPAEPASASGADIAAAPAGEGEAADAAEAKAPRKSARGVSRKKAAAAAAAKEPGARSGTKPEAKPGAKPARKPGRPRAKKAAE